MTQPALFHETPEDALRELVSALGGYKAVGVRMRPEMSADHAGRWLADCLNDQRREHLTLHQLLWLLGEGRRNHLHNAMAWIAGEAGYSAPQPIEPDDERDRLQREFIAATQLQAQLLTRLERMTGQVQAQSSAPAAPYLRTA